MIYITVNAGADTEHEFTEFWVPNAHLPNLIAALGLLSEELAVPEAMAMV